jgi:hypothetical protein
VLRGDPFNETSDLYRCLLLPPPPLNRDGVNYWLCSFGVVMWELLTLRPPWEGMDPFQLPVHAHTHYIWHLLFCC